MSDKHPKKRKVGRMEPMREATLGEVLTSLGIHDWDVVVFGDGSGVGRARGCGWCVVLVDHFTGARKQFRGAMDPGTVNIAEMLPYHQALEWYHEAGPGKQRLYDRRLASGPVRKLHVHVISDSEVVVNQGNNPDKRKANGSWWAAIDFLADKGYQLHWHWMGRDRTALNMYCDHISRQSREAVEGVEEPPDISIYELNPGPAYNQHITDGTVG